ncbi:hypothetical protein ACFPK9_03315 [Rubritalea spongiae]|uniref:DUF2934 domain-containing protein n=1 Tax=Rubritalea spongiae TaxID=430797 RepID=A0ABW5E305_9BACT
MAKKTAKKATVKKTAKKAAKKTATKASKKVAPKKTTKKSAKKASKKAKAAEQELDLTPKQAPTYDELQQAAYFNYMERLKKGKPGTPELDWTKAEQDLA